MTAVLSWISHRQYTTSTHPRSTARTARGLPGNGPGRDRPSQVSMWGRASTTNWPSEEYSLWYKQVVFVEL
jgi:hypothetical protein